jgi:hypothetical protein
MSSFDQALRLVLVLLNNESAPTIDIIRENCENVAEMLKKQTNFEPFDVEYLIKVVESRSEMWKGRATVLEDNQRSHVIWLPKKKNQIQWKFWNRYRRYLSEEKKMGESSVSKIDALTDNVLELLEDPDRDGEWDRRGMVVGQVQSGKTSNYTGLICKAADAGYKLIIILAGMHKSLRSQTQLRVDEGFLGFDTRKGRKYDNENQRIGVGKLFGEEFLIAHPLTSSEDNGDFNKRVAQQVGVLPGGADPVILVVKKQKSVLANLIQWATSVQGKKDPQTGKIVVRNIPLLVIDDEADNASVNTKLIPTDEDGQPLPDYEVSAINEKIRKLLDHFEKCAYVGYTATPFANIFIFPEAKISTVGEDLFPRDFILNLPAPPNYIGPSQIFGFEGNEESEKDAESGLPIIRIIDDYQDKIPDNHPKTFIPKELPESLKKAIKSFIISCAARNARGERSSHNSMLVHVTRYIDVQSELSNLISNEMTAQRRRLEYEDSASGAGIYAELEKIWNDDYVNTIYGVKTRINDPLLTPLEWSNVRVHLSEAASRIRISTINGTAKDVLDYKDNPDGLSVIAIGGDKLSRGLTLEGLTVSYYLRASRMYDTLMQMGRWFGFRPGYVDLCRLYTSKELVDWYKFINMASEELRQEFDYMASLKSTPRDYGLRVRTHPDGLRITAANRMRSGTEMEVTFSNTLQQTVFFEKNSAIHKQNLNLITRVIEQLGKESENLAKSPTWRNVSPEMIFGILNEYHFCKGSFRPELLREYIQKQNLKGELTSWTVVLINIPSAMNQFTISGYNIGLSTRNPDDNQRDLYAIKKGQIIDKKHEFIDLTREQYERALQKMLTDPGRKQTGENVPDMPSGPYIRGERPPINGLLLIYLLDPAPKGVDIGVPVTGLAFSFPGSRTASRVIYTVNNKYWEQEFASE